MKAITQYIYGGPEVLKFEDLPDPQPGPDQVLVRVHAASLNAADWHIMRADPWPARLSSGLFRPKHRVLGCDLAGVVEAVGSGVTRFKVGEAVMGDLSGCGLGAFAELVPAKESALALKPANVSFEEAAATPLAGVTALQAVLRKGGLKAGERVLIHGASGGVGTFAVQIAKHLGGRVTAVCGPSNIEKVRALGADEVLDYTKDDFAKREGAWDLSVACNGDRRLADYKRALAPGGRHWMVGGSWDQMKEALIKAPFYGIGSGKSFAPMIAASNLEDLEYLCRCLAEGSLKPVIDRVYPLEKAAEAMVYLEEGHAKGKIVLRMGAH